MILITGAGGKTGRALIQSLSEAETVCAFVHREEQGLAARSLGAEKVVVGDLREEAAVRAALEGVRAVYHICPNMSPDEMSIGELVIEEAQKAGVEKFVYHSVLHPQTEKMMHHWQKLRVEEMIFESGLPFTILQPAPYMQNLLASWKGIVEEGILRIPYSIESKFSFVDLEDVAEAARFVLTDPGHLHATYELAGTTPISHIEVADVFSGALKREVRADKMELSDWRLQAGKMSEYALENLTRMFEYYDRWGLVGNPNVLWWLLQREPVSVEKFLAKWLEQQAA